MDILEILTLPFRAKEDKSACQRFGAVLYGEYRGQVIDLVPVVDENDRSKIVDWINDPQMVKAIDARLGRKDSGGRESMPPTLPPARNSEPGGFDPSSVPGL